MIIYLPFEMISFQRQCKNRLAKNVVVGRIRILADKVTYIVSLLKWFIYIYIYIVPRSYAVSF